ncbi:MAG: DUF1398 family protein [Flavobacteriales bacterium]|nr:DUF1398 family protein [Flavobacteriales bacterium]
MPTTDRHDLEDRSTLERIRRIVAGMRRYGDLSHTIGALADLGVDRFHMHVSDGSTRFHGTRFFQLYGPALHARVSISEVTDHDLVERAYRLFQEGVTDLRTFLGHGADAGVDMLVVHVQDRMFVLLDQHGRILGIHPIGVPAERLN